MNLAKKRKEAGLTQVEAAKKLNVGQSTISMWEKERNGPKSKMLPAIAKVYNCKIEELY